MTRTNTNPKMMQQRTFQVKDKVLVGNELVFPESTLNAGEIVLQLLKSKPDFIGQIEASTGKQLTYEEMADKSMRCAIWLRKQGVKRGDTVAVCTFSCLDAYVPFLACLYIGAVCAVEHHTLPLRVCRNFLSLITPRVIFIHGFAVNDFSNAQAELNMNIQRVVFEDGIPNEESLYEILMEQTTNEVENFRCERIDNPRAPALLISTSGSTGTPKIAELSHLSMRTLLHPVYTRSVKHHKVCLCATAFRWIPYFIYMLKCIRCNSTRIVTVDEKDANYYYDIIKKYKVEYYLVDSNQLRKIYKHKLAENYASTDLKTIVFGGSAFSQEVHKSLIEQLPRINIWQTYGSTDAGICLTQQLKGCTPGSVGYVWEGVKVKIVCPETGRTLGANEQGEICVKTTAQMNGYRKNQTATAKAIDSEGWLHMNDIGYYDENGEIFIVGRLSEFIKYKECCLSVSEIEAVLDMHPAVYQSVVVPIPADVEGDLPFAVVIPLPGKEITEAELMTYCENNLPYFYKMGGIKFVKNIPCTNTGKVSKTEIKQMISQELI
ncbi:PREDICTED: 4-coumarate--CoA ligase 1-like [Eufriesea mexicana]|uniref:4-coumarate--CoA ligase 1-like n=1 Tax=Eufriesea mexicana TaxID=516756 RepID=UPI00083C1558|nr:PREDICTED: 4-coumarate--CoA ligase 1-like [Eufriesea mexicana]